MTSSAALTDEQRAHIEARARARAEALVVDDETAETLRILLSKPAARTLVEQRAAGCRPPD